MDDLFAEALARFRGLLDQAAESGDPEPTAMTLASADAQGRPSARTVLLKGFDARGFVFYTHRSSPKGNDLRDNPRTALLFHWKLMRPPVQVRIEGRAEVVADDEADAYFASRPRMSQVGAWASLQSQTLDSRATFEARVAQTEREFAGCAVPRPPGWGGYRIVPDGIEFWYAADFRLHERWRYDLRDGAWSRRMLYP